MYLHKWFPALIWCVSRLSSDNHQPWWAHLKLLPLDPDLSIMLQTKKLLVVPFNTLKRLILKFIWKKTHHANFLSKADCSLPSLLNHPLPPQKNRVQLKRQEVQVIIQKLVLGGIEFLLEGCSMQKTKKTSENLWVSSQKKSHYKKYV